MQWGAPVTENFDTNTGRWYVYNYPKTPPRRSSGLTSIAGGVLRLRGETGPGGVDIGSGVSDRSFHQKYGRWEARFRVTPGAGFGVAILLWPENNSLWPEDGEVDLVEIPAADRQKAIHSIHNGPDNLRLQHGLTADFTTWHTVAVDWLPNGLTYYLDGTPTWQITLPALIPSTGPLHMTLQLDECAPEMYHGFIPCRTDGSASAGVELQVDWVKVYPPPPNL
ncbi:glycoside hydrolase family 16 protein [Parafrankia sp. EUN1f]|uniref:glycoside hydrolase family 16 protein n=1 Tax=Parafrankia sp. EUN1f TaxID=102897 RepID=UPI0001C451F7|nr:glycoside hydrolase family 16 protein [Parafrankia sp. EUN1f]EFC82834.1 glycoside hydrolase family 16 [Parafrankia sp. EUN1f]